MSLLISLRPRAIADIIFYSNGVIQPFRQLGWWQWMYRLSPYTYLIEGLLGQALGKSRIECSEVEYATVDPYQGQKCGEFFESYISMAGGYVKNEEATSGCQFCSTRTADEFLGNNFNIMYSHHWRNLGIYFAFILFNVCSFPHFLSLPFVLMNFVRSLLSLASPTGSVSGHGVCSNF